MEMGRTTMKKVWRFYGVHYPSAIKLMINGDSGPERRSVLVYRSIPDRLIPLYPKFQWKGGVISKINTFRKTFLRGELIFQNSHFSKKFTTSTEFRESKSKEGSGIKSTIVRYHTSRRQDTNSSELLPKF